MVKNRRRKSSQKGDNISLLDDPDASPERYNLHVGSSRTSNKQSTSKTNTRSGEGQSLRNSSTALPPESRFAPQHEPKAAGSTLLVPSRAAVLQFVPAYEESTSPNTLLQQEEAPAPTWDAIIEADSGRGRSLSWGRKPKIPSPNKSHSVDRSISSVESAGTGIFRKKKNLRSSPVRSGSSKSPGKRPLGTAVPRTSISPAKQRPDVSRNGEGTSIVSGASSRKGTRIARLASLFSNRSVATKGEEAPILTPESKRLMVKSKSTTRVSPPQSESSNDYSGWPGTQDKRGGTVAIQSSYDDSSVGAAGVTTFHRKKYDLNMDDNAVEEEVRKWMNDPSFDDSTVTEKSSPRHRSVINTSQESKLSNISRNTSHESSRIMSEQSFTDEEENPADFHLAALVANASNAPRSPLAENTTSPAQSYRRKKLNEARAKRQTGVPGYSSGRPRSTKSSAGSTTSALSINHLFRDEQKPRNSPSREQIRQAFDDDPWDVDEYERTPSSTGTSVSKSSSAFFQTRGISSESPYGIQPNMRDLNGSYSTKVGIANKVLLATKGSASYRRSTCNQ